MRRFTAAALAAICVLAAACGGNNSSAPAASSAKSGASSSTSSTPPPPVAVSALDGLLLSAAQINTAMGATGITVTKTQEQMEDTSASVHDSACVFAGAPADTSDYAGSGWSAVRGQRLEDAANLAQDKYLVLPYVVLFPSAGQAAAFFTASSQQRWPACSNRQYTAAAAENQSITITWDVSPVSNTDGTLSLTQTEERTNGWACQRALAVRNNVVIDVSACSFNLGDSAVKITNQIAAKVPKE